MLSVRANAEDIFDLAAEYNTKKHKVLNLEEGERKILSDLYSIEKETNKVVVQKNELDEKKFKLDGKMAVISKKIISIKRDLQALTPNLTERLAFTEQINNLPWFYAFLTSQSVLEFDHLLETANRINSSQAEEVLSFAQLINSLEQQHILLKKTATEIVRLKKDILRKEKEIAKNQQVKKKRLKKLKALLGVEKKSLSKLKVRGERATSFSELKNLGLLFGTGFFDKKGHLPHPIKSPVLMGYGLNRRLNSDHVVLMQKGNFYRSNKNVKVMAVSEGRVRFAKRVPGFGAVVIIDHGGRYYTIYANLGKLLLRKGIEVKSGDVVGVTGHKHLQYEVGLYFEIRHFSQPQNPEVWLRPPDGQLATL